MIEIAVMYFSVTGGLASSTLPIQAA